MLRLTIACASIAALAGVANAQTAPVTTDAPPPAAGPATPEATPSVPMASDPASATPPVATATDGSPAPDATSDGAKKKKKHKPN